MSVGWDAGHCYCECEHCSPEDVNTESDSMNCNQELYCEPDGGCGCTESMSEGEFADHIEGFIGLITEPENIYMQKYYPLTSLENKVKILRLIELKETVTLTIKRD